MTTRGLIAIGLFNGQVASDGQTWYRVCCDCGQLQDDRRHINEPCQYCGGPAIWTPWWEIEQTH